MLAERTFVSDDLVAKRPLERRRDTSVTRKNTEIVNLRSNVCAVGSIAGRRML